MPTIGLTGNFGMGKTTVLKMFSRAGAFTFNIDTIVHSILDKDKIIERLANILGREILLQGSDKPSINRKRMAGIIFSDPEKRRAAEKIIHPEVLKAIKQTEAEILKRSPGAVIVFEVPLLFEAGYEKHFDKVVVVCCKRDNALSRLAGKGFSKDEALGRMRAQMPITAKIKRSDFSINNNDDIRKTEKRVKRILAAIQ